MRAPKGFYRTIFKLFKLPIKYRVLKGNRGFTLLEVLVAIFVIIIGVTGAVNLISYTVSGVVIGKSQIIATNLAQEGIEIVRNIRDSNWIEQRSDPGLAWNDGLGADDWSVQYNSPSLLSFTNVPLQLNSNGFYGYDGVQGYAGGTDTRFKRTITITNISGNEIKVVSQISWSERGRSYTVNAEDRLFNWK